ncbi:hypothetical protein QL996_04565 [Planococcus sp. APC 4015]|nr:hypothetical protein [Planococcus sp. APC 4015]
MGEDKNTQGTPGEEIEADTASGGAPDEPDMTTDEHGKPVENPSG